MPVSPDMGRSIADIVESVKEVDDRLQFGADVRETIDLFLSGDPDVNTKGIIVGLSAAEMLKMGYSPEEVQHVLEAGIAELTKPAQ
ncbi:hypothetical protein HY410_00935 [Candidatus Gottesmanbacteria bacterium]|nr:hypothetical protein [Candidatus Gottesmanbacteria bacterium]